LKRPILLRILFACFWLAASSLFAEIIRLDFVQTNDIHGGIDRGEATFMNPEFPPLLGGGASLVTYVNELRETKDHVWLVDCGDIFQGTPIGALKHGEIVVEFLNRANYDFWVIGNHDFDEGYDNLKRLVELSDPPVLCANIVEKETGELIPGVDAYIIREVAGIRIGILGLSTTDTKSMSLPEHIEGVEFLSVYDVAQKYIRILKEEEKVDMVFGATHLGLPYDLQESYEKLKTKSLDDVQSRLWGMNAMELARFVDGFDVIFTGHIHVGFPKPWIDPDNHTLVFQDYGRGSGLLHATLLIDSETKSLVGYELPTAEGSATVTIFSDEFMPDPEVSTYIDSQTAIAEAGMDEVLGEAEIDLIRGDATGNLGYFVVDAMRESVQGDFAFLNLGGVRDNIYQGAITRRHLHKVMPFANQVVILDISGKTLRHIVEFRVSGTHHGLITSGAEIVYNPTREDYDRITRFKIDGETIDPNKKYRVITTDFLAQGNAGLKMLLELPEEQIVYTGTELKKSMEDYVRKHQFIHTVNDNRWIKDDSATPDEELQNLWESIPLP